MNGRRQETIRMLKESNSTTEYLQENLRDRPLSDKIKTL